MAVAVAGPRETHVNWVREPWAYSPGGDSELCLEEEGGPGKMI